MMIVVLFNCAGCGLLRKTVEVRYRGPSEPLKQWVDHVIATVIRCHQTYSPGCRAIQKKDILVPNSGGMTVGMEPPGGSPVLKQWVPSDGSK